MKHYPAQRYAAPLAGLTHARAPRAVSLTTALLIGALLFATGFTAAVYTIGFIVTQP